MAEPKVSIVVPVYNAERHLLRCLASLQTQSLSDIEVVLVNDGSSVSRVELVL